MNKNSKTFMNIHTGSVDTWESWVEESHTWADPEAELASLVEVVQDENGDWIEV